MSSLKRLSSIILWTSLAWGWGSAEVQAYETWVASLPNGEVIECAACHVIPGGDINPFGLEVEKAYEFGSDIWNASFASKDSDGDGYTNGEELGDPEGDFTILNVGVFSPGDPNSKPPDPDLNKRGIVDLADITMIVNQGRLGVIKGAPGYDPSIDFDGDLQLGIDDLLIFARNFNRAGYQANLERPPDDVGPNKDAVLFLDGNVGNRLNDGVDDGSIDPSGSTFSAELFLENLQSSIAGVAIRFDVDSSQLSVKGFSVPGGESSIPLTNDFELAVVFIEGLDLGESGFLGTVEFQSTRDRTDIPIQVGVESAVVIESGTLFRNELDLSHAGIALNSQETEEPSEPQPPSVGVAGRVGDLDGDEFVGFLDFLVFVRAFDSSEGDAGFVAEADLNGNGKVDFFDFTQFALNFDKNVSEIVLTKPEQSPYRYSNWQTKFEWLLLRAVSFGSRLPDPS